MSRLLVGVNVLLVAASAMIGVYLTRQASAPMKTPEARPRPTAAPAAAAAPDADPKSAGAPAASSYSMVASRNLFSPTRTEAPPPPPTSQTAPARQLPKPNLYGVVLGDGTPVAYLEDPTTKRVAGYRLGDSIAGGTVQTISPDRVVLARPEGNVDIRLHDPAKPRPAPQPAPGQPGVPGQVAPRPGTLGAVPAAPSGQAGAPQPGFVPQPGVAQPGDQQPAVPGRRPLPPNLLRRLPPGTVPPGPSVDAPPR